MSATSLSALQRSRALSSAEIAVKDDAAPEPAGFNGAALFRARRFLKLWRGEWQGVLASTEPRSFERGDLRGRDGAPRHHRRFNGAALFRARR